MRRSSLAHRRAVDAADRVGLVERERPGIDQAAHGIGLEARAFLVGEGDERQRPARGGAGVVRRLAGFEPGEHAVESVVAAAGSDRVDVRAEHHRGCVLASGAHADDVADRVDGHLEAELAHPLHEQVAPGVVLVAQREPAIAAAGQRPDAVEGLEPAEQAVAVDVRVMPPVHAR